MSSPKHASRKPVEILLVEDSLGDIRLMQEAFREAGCTGNLCVTRNSQQALAFLHREKPYETSGRPALVLLDWNLAGTSGGDLLAKIKGDRGLRQIPVIVLSASTRAEDVARAYELHANCYISKPADLESLVKVTRTIEAFWLETATLAPGINSRLRLQASRKTA